MSTAEYPDWDTPQQHANRIAATGAPLLNLKGMLTFNNTGLAIPALGIVTLPASGAFSIGQVSYEAVLQVSTLAGTATPVAVLFTWLDSTSGITVASQEFTFFAGSVASPHLVEGHGPSNSDQLVIQLINNSGANAISVSYAFLQSSRPRDTHLWRTQNTPAIPGFTMASSFMRQNILCAESQALALNAGVNLLLPFYTGTVRLFATTTDATGANLQIILFYNSALITLNDDFPYKALGNSGFSPGGQSTLEAENIVLARSQMSIQLFNKNAAAGETLTAHLVAQENFG